MNNSLAHSQQRNHIIKWLTYLMFMMFAMTTDAVGEIIPEVMKQFNLNMTAAGLLHYCPMTAIAFAGILLGFIADKLGRKWTIIIGLALFATNSFLFLAGNSFAGGVFTIIFLPLSGLFMSVIYPTINSKGISCFPKSSHGAVAGIILFFTAAGAALGPLAMGAISDIFDSNAKYGFMLATVFAAMLFAGTLLNLIFNPTKNRLEQLNKSEY